jgi:intein/homing endonuclease
LSNKNLNQKYKCKLLPYQRIDLVSAQDASQKVGWALTAFDIPNLWKYTKGENIVVAVLDTGCDLNHQDLKENIIEGYNFIQNKKPPEDDNGHGCVSPDTLIHTSYSGIDEIKNLYNKLDCPEEHIKNKDGVYSIKDVSSLNIKTISLCSEKNKTVVSNIKSIQKLSIKEKIVNVCLEGNVNFKLTPWHPVYLFKNENNEILRKRADEICLGDNFIIPQQTDFGETQFFSFCEKDNCDVKKIEISEDIAWLFGLILSKGEISKNFNQIKINSNKIQTLEKVKNISEKIGFLTFFEKNKIYICGKNSIQLILSSGIILNKKTFNKSIPKWVGKSKNNIVFAFISGIFDGNDSIICKHKFAKKLCSLLSSINVSCGYKKNKSKYEVFYPFNSKDKKENYHKVKKIEFEDYDGFFYDFTVEKYHNYVANGYFVSNTHVTGIIAAQDNEIGIIGVCPKAKIRPVKVLDRKGNGNMINVAMGIKWAADQGVDLITMSLGASVKIQQVRKAIQYAASKGIVTFCAAGNYGKTKEIFYPANYPESIAIGAIDENFNRANFSNTGQNLDFMAPGVDILSTSPSNWYATLSGTSMACPFAVRVTALIKSYYKNINSDFKIKSPEECREILKKYTIPLNNSTINESKFYGGFGILDPRKFFEKLN